MIIYITSGFDVKFSGNAAIPGQNIAYIFSNTSEIKDSLTMYMKFVDKSDPDNAMEMECVSIQKDKLVKKNSEYNFL